MKHKNKFKYIFLLILLLIIVAGFSCTVNAASDNNVLPLPSIDINIGSGDSASDTASTIQLLLLLTIIVLVPSILITFTCFTRIIIVLHFLRTALGTQQMPPNQILIGMALFLTLFVMEPTFNEIYDNAYVPYSQGEISQEQFFDDAMEPIREFMFSQVENKDLTLFADIAGGQSYNSKEEVPNSVLIPAYIMGEVTKGFKIGFVLYIPFIAIDMIVASVLMAMGMMMLPPALISAPFKILLFILVDGWNLVIGSLLKTFK